MEKNYKVELYKPINFFDTWIDDWFFESKDEANAFIKILIKGKSTDLKIKLYEKKDWTLYQTFYDDVPD